MFKAENSGLVIPRLATNTFKFIRYILVKSNQGYWTDLQTMGSGDSMVMAMG